MAIQESKSILAKLLATENITVSHQNVKTAYFDLESRTMVLPVWKDMDGHLYDLLTGHEVGHALNTPKEGWHDQVSTSSKKFKDFLNVIEDARIEKLIKRKFPGLSKSFALAYASLYDRDFFGVKKLGDLNKLNLIDRINLRFKLGAHVVVSFNDFERDIVREIEVAETWDHVVDIAKRVYDYVKENEPDKIQSQQDLRDTFSEQMSDDLDNQNDSEEESDDLDDLDDNDDADGESDDESEAEEGSDSSESQSSSQKDSDDEEDADDADGDDAFTRGGGDSEEDEDNDPQSVTDRNFRRREEELVNASGKVFMYNLPEVDLDNIILPNTEVVNDLEQYFKKQIAEPHKPYGRAKVSYETVVQKSVRRFNSENKKVIMHILKEFEMRKKASQYARAQTARTGELNMNVLHKYKFSNDLFRKITVVPKGKNHGYILFVDMSGSMCDLIRNTIDQLLILTSFCKLAKIPFEAYGFSDDYYNNPKLKEMKSKHSFISDEKTEMFVSNCDWFHLKHLIGTSLSPLQYRKAFNMLCVVAAEYKMYRSYSYGKDDAGCFDGWCDSGFGLHGTPFCETLLASREIITKFQKLHQLEVCNVVYLTDGEGNANRVNFPKTSEIATHGYISRDFFDAVVYVVDKKTQKKIKFDTRYVSNEMQSKLTQLVADVTGCKHIGFYIMHRKALSRSIRDYMRDKSFEEVENAKKSVRENNFFACSNLGYEKYFYVGLPSDNVKDEALNITQEMNKSKMAKVFANTLTSKRTNRLLLTKLAEELAVA